MTLSTTSKASESKVLIDLRSDLVPVSNATLARLASRCLLISTGMVSKSIEEKKLRLYIDSKKILCNNLQSCPHIRQSCKHMCAKVSMCCQGPLQTGCTRGGPATCTELWLQKFSAEHCRRREACTWIKIFRFPATFTCIKTETVKRQRRNTSAERVGSSTTKPETPVHNFHTWLKQCETWHENLWDMSDMSWVSEIRVVALHLLEGFQQLCL